MRTLTLNWDPPKRHLRSMAWAVALILAVIACCYEASLAGWVLRVAAATIFGVGTVLPRTLRLPYLLLLFLIYPLLWLARRALPAPRDRLIWRASAPRPRPRRPAQSLP